MLVLGSARATLAEGTPVRVAQPDATGTGAPAAQPPRSEQGAANPEAGAQASEGGGRR